MAGLSKMDGGRNDGKEQTKAKAKEGFFEKEQRKKKELLVLETYNL